jgi:hypothetical protein
MFLADSAGTRLGASVVTRSNAPTARFVHTREDAIKEVGLVVLDVAAECIGAEVGNLDQAREATVHEEGSLHEERDARCPSRALAVESSH